MLFAIARHSQTATKVWTSSYFFPSSNSDWISFKLLNNAKQSSSSSSSSSIYEGLLREFLFHTCSDPIIIFHPTRGWGTGKGLKHLPTPFHIRWRQTTENNWQNKNRSSVPKQSWWWWWRLWCWWPRRLTAGCCTSEVYCHRRLQRRRRRHFESQWTVCRTSAARFRPTRLRRCPPVSTHQVSK